MAWRRPRIRPNSNTLEILCRPLLGFSSSRACPASLPQPGSKSLHRALSGQRCFSFLFLQVAWASAFAPHFSAAYPCHVSTYYELICDGYFSLKGLMGAGTTLPLTLLVAFFCPLGRAVRRYPRPGGHALFGGLRGLLLTHNAFITALLLAFASADDVCLGFYLPLRATALFSDRFLLRFPFHPVVVETFHWWALIYHLSSSDFFNSALTLLFAVPLAQYRYHG